MTWPPKEGELWMTLDRWPETGTEPEIPGGAWLTILKGSPRWDPIAQANWWRGMVLGPHGVAWINAVEGDLLPGDDPRICASAA